MASGYVDWHKRTYTDIIAQSIEKILVDIGAVSVDELPVNIKAQDLSKMNIDVTAQTIERLIISHSLGTAHKLEAGGYIHPGEEITLYDIEMGGILYGGYIVTGPNSRGSQVRIIIESDGVQLTNHQIELLHSRELTDPNDGVIYLTQYDLDHYIFTVTFTREFTWDESYKVKLELPSAVPEEVPYVSELFFALR